MNHSPCADFDREHHGEAGVIRLGVTAAAAVVALLCAIALAVSPALASATTAHKGKPTPHRVGGKVHKAWPRSGKPPRSALARWLARQVGPTKVRACTTRVHGKVVKCHRKRPPGTGAPLPGGQLGRPRGHTIAAPGFMGRGEDMNPIAYAASSSGSTTPTAATGQTNLQLDRSYQIPTDDPSYTRLLNWSWTYDSAISALSLTTFGAPSVGEEILDQLAALQHTDGSIEIAFNVSDGTTEPVFRSGSTTPTASTGQTNLQLDRSYQIPTDDPSYTRLLNWSWTYDSAISALSLTTFGAPSIGEEILDQLAALQHTDGSIEIAFNVSDGTTEAVFRSGTIATMGLAGSIYDQSQHTNRYLTMEQRAASYLISLQGTNGLIRGGPDVGWYSTQHNLLAYAFLNQLGAELISANQRSTANTYLNAANKISSGLESKLLVHNGSQAWFIEGLGDNVQSLDADALGVLYLVSKNETTVAQEVLSYTQSAFALSGRSIGKSTNAPTYNNTYAAAGPFSGFKPFIGTNAPDVLWTEGSAEMELADAALSQPTATLNASLLSIYALTPTVAPLMADRTLTDPTYSAEFHVWPADAAGAWFLLAQKRPTLFAKVS